MALINCPKCNGVVSDKAIKCPHCGIDLLNVANEGGQAVQNETAHQNEATATSKITIKCPTCGKALRLNDAPNVNQALFTCPNCHVKHVVGNCQRCNPAPVQAVVEKPQGTPESSGPEASDGGMQSAEEYAVGTPSKHKTRNILCIILAIVVVGAGVFWGVTSLTKKSAETCLTFTVNGVSFDMLMVEAGTFTMGATSEMQNPLDDEKPTHQVTITKNYYMGKTEVTQALWEAVMGDNPSHFKGSNKPVENVSWNECQEFISKLNAATGKKFRLPTEAEWEFAARGGNKSQHYQYSGSNILSDVAWSDDGSAESSHDVATKKPNELGLYDMSGNIWEWCSDWYGEYGSDNQSDPTGPTTGTYRVNRGGGWGSAAKSCRVSYRNRIRADYSSEYLGLRLCLSEDGATDMAVDTTSVADGQVPDSEYVDFSAIDTIVREHRDYYEEENYEEEDYNEPDTSAYYL